MSLVLGLSVQSSDCESSPWSESSGLWSVSAGCYIWVVAIEFLVCLQVVNASLKCLIAAPLLCLLTPGFFDTNTHTQTHIYSNITCVIHTHTHTFIHTHAHTHTHTFIHTHAHTHTHAHIHTHTRAHTRTHTRTHSYTHTRTHTRAHTHARTLTHAHMHRTTIWMGESERSCLWDILH